MFRIHPGSSWFKPVPRMPRIHKKLVELPQYILLWSFAEGSKRSSGDRKILGAAILRKVTGH